jgi:alpha-beta hydrolase superfamily lysophospholipase
MGLFNLLIQISHIIFAVLLAWLIWCVPPARGHDGEAVDGVNQEQREQLASAPVLAERLSMPIREWQSKTGQTRAYLLAIHGLSLHGQVYNRMGEELSRNGITVVAPDLRGYGGRTSRDSATAAVAGTNAQLPTSPSPAADKIDYAGSLKDLAAIVDELHRRSPGAPIYVLGESLGASMAIQLAAIRPDIVDGLILSAPGVKLHHCLSLNMVPSVLRMFVDDRHELNIAPYLRKHFSNDEAIVSEHLTDRAVRTRFSIKAIFSTCKVVRQTLKASCQVPGHVPVLILQGGEDKMLKPAGAQRLRVSFARHDADLVSLPEAGHILLETSRPNPGAMRAVTAWLSKQMNRSSFVAQVPETQHQLNLNSEL